MNEYALKRRRPYHTGEDYLRAPAFGAPDYSHAPVFPAPSAAVPTAGAGLYMLSPEEHVVVDQTFAALYNSLDLSAFDPSFGNFGDTGTSIGDIGDIYAGSLPYQNTIYPQVTNTVYPQATPPPNPRKRQRSITDQDMPRFFNSKIPALAEKPLADDWHALTSSGSLNLGTDPTCSDSLIMSCFPAGALARWKDFCNSCVGDSHVHHGYQQLPQTSQGVYGNSPENGGNGSQGPISAPVVQILSSEPPELGHMLASPKAAPAPPPYTPTYPHTVPHDPAQTGFVQRSVPGPNMAAILPSSQSYIESTSQQALGIYQHGPAPTSHIGSRLATQRHQFPSSQADLALLDTYHVPASGATAVPGAMVPYYSTGSPALNLGLQQQQHSVPVRHEMHRGHAAPTTLGYPERPPSYALPMHSGLSGTSEPAQSSIPATAPHDECVDVVARKHKPLPTRRGPFRDTAAREKTAQTRKMGSCIRCKMQRIRCEFDENTSDFGPCITCQKVSSTKIWRLPCLRYKLTDIQLNKPGQVRGYEWTARWKDSIVENISLWASNETRQICVSQDGMPVPLRLRVRKFLPQPGDKLARTWNWNGAARSADIPPYAIVDLESVEGAYMDMIEGGIVECLESIIRDQPGLLRETYLRAWMLAQDPNTPQDDRDILMQAFMLWVAVRLGTRSDVIVGPETLDMPRNIMDETSPLHGKIPLPPVMGAQLELVLSRHLIPRLRKSLLLQLQKISQANQARNWLVMYLVFFLLLDNTSLLFLHDKKYVEKHGIKKTFAREETVREYYLGANVILAYFHYCNKGIYPFSQMCKDDELKSLADLGDGWIHFIKYTRAEVLRMKDEWAAVRDRKEYSHHFFFVSQMFEEQWQPKSIET